MKYRKKPIVIEAYQTDVELDIETLEGTMHANIGDYIITGVNGEKYPCKPDIFEKTYEKVDGSEKTKLSPLEALENIRREAGTPRFSSLYDIDDWKEDFNTILYALKEKEQDQKKLKALEIIKEKKVDCLLIVISQTVMDYNDMCEEDNVKLTKEEFNLLKEVLL